jgi:benzoyl-CoA reductase/2-hydroxyglutaryl-CoA dehydratase subunit BcrC/BadD/HgdB
MSETELLLPARKDLIREHQANGGMVAAVFPIHYPRELLRAHGVLPIEVWGPPGRDASVSDRYLQAYTCSIVRGGMAFLQSGGLDAVDLIVVPNPCDSLQGLGTVLLDFQVTDKPVLTVYNPRGGKRASALAYLADELGVMAAHLGKITGRSPTARTSIALEDRDFYRLVRSREYLPVEDFVALGERYLEGAGEPQTGRVPVVLSGLVPEPMSFLDIVSEAGAVIVADDCACSGRRLYPDGESELPLVRMAERILGASPCSTRGSPIQARIDHLLDLATRTQSKAVIFFEVKFCEPEQFYLPLVRAGLDAAGVRSIVLEVDVTDTLPRQAATRVEALLETLS